MALDVKPVLVGQFVSCKASRPQPRRWHPVKPKSICYNWVIQNSCGVSLSRRS